LFSVIRGLAIAALLWMLDLWSSCRTVSVETVFKTNIEFCCHLCCSNSVVFRYSPSCRPSLSLSYGFRLLLLLNGDVFPWFVYVVITWETAVLYVPNKVAVLVSDATAKCAIPVYIRFEFLKTYFGALSYELLLNTICNALTLALHSINKEKNKEGCSQLMLFQCSQHKQCHFCIKECFQFLSISCI